MFCFCLNHIVCVTLNKRIQGITALCVQVNQDCAQWFTTVKGSHLMMSHSQAQVAQDQDKNVKTLGTERVNPVQKIDKILKYY